MLNQQAVMNSLPLVASVLGRKYGVKVEIGGAEAYTDGSTIRLPSLPVEVPDTFLAMVRGFLDHEAGHVRDTDFQALRDAALTPFEMHVWNTLEDQRVEHKLASIFPGCRKNFDWLIGHMFGTDQSDNPIQPAAMILNWLLLEVRSWDVQALSGHRDKVAGQVDRLFPGVRDQIGQILKLVRTNCHSTRDAIDFARQIASVFRNFSDGRNQDNQGHPKRTSGEQEHHAQGSSSASGNEKLGAQDSSEESQTATHGSVLGEDDSDQSELKGITDHDQVLGDGLLQVARDHVRELLTADADVLPQNFGALLASELQNAAFQTRDDSVTVAIPVPKAGALLAEDEAKDAMTASLALRTKLGGLLQTHVLRRVATGRRGRLDTGRIYRVSISDAKVFRAPAERIGLDTAVHILLDSSGSMVRRIRLACGSCYAVATSLENSGINVALTAFPSTELPDGSYATVAPLVTHGQKVHARVCPTPTGSTPMGESLWWVLQNMLSLKEKRRLILVVTDGEPDSFERTMQAFTYAQKIGFEVFGIGIMSTAISQLLPERSVVIHSMTDLAPSMFTLLEGGITRR